MSRITGNDAKGLMEAYSAVYTPQELTEEQVWEEVETWVNSLLEEGYDLSDYTWEEMYESYIEEVKDLNLTKGISKDAQAQLRQRRANIEARGGTLGQIGRVLTRGFGSGEQISKLDAEDKADRRREQTALNRSSNPNWKPNTKNTKDVDTKNTKDVDTKITTPATTKVAPKPALGPTGMPLVGGIERRLPTRAEMDAAKAYRTPAATTGTLGAATAAAKPNAFGSSTSAATPAPKPAATPVPAATPGATPAAKPVVKRDPNLGLNARERMRQNQSFDYFDVVKGHLIDEGYADTEEAALVIMANMSEEWREEILEGLVDAVASGAGTVVGTAQRAAREIPKYVQQKVKNVAGTYEYARQRADANAPSGKMTTNPRSREFSHGNQGGKPAPMKPMKTMRNPGPNFGRG